MTSAPWMRVRMNADAGVYRECATCETGVGRAGVDAPAAGWGEGGVCRECATRETVVGRARLDAPAARWREESRMPIAIRNTTVVTSDAARTVHHDATIVVDGDRIVAIGPTDEIDRRHPGAERI